MKKKKSTFARIAIPGAIAAAAAANAVRAARFVPEKKDYGTLSPENVDAERAQRNLSKAISIPTISYPEKENVDFTQFDKFHEFLDEAYPLIHKTLTKEVGRAPEATLTPLLCLLIRMSSLFRRAPRAIGSILPLRATTTANSSGAEALWI